MQSRRLETWARRLRWLAPAALLAPMPKCFVCVLAYAGLASAFGLGGNELCGAPPGSTGAWKVWAAISIVATTATILLLARRRSRRAMSR